jgi:hypothetical protein
MPERAQGKETAMKVCALAISLVFIAGDAFAYVDPGISGSFFQLAYFLIFGVLFAWVTKPVTFIKNMFSKKKKDSGKDQSAEKHKTS